MWARVSASLKRFRADRRGSVAVIFAAAGIGLSLTVAGGIEMYRRNLATALVQKAADAAALAGKRFEADARGTGSAADARAKGTAEAIRMFQNALPVGEGSRLFGDVMPAPTVTWLEDGSIRVNATGKFNMIFGGFLPESLGRVQATAIVGFGVPLPTEVALVLDNTSSMFQKDGRAQTRFTQLRDAAKSFTHTLFDAAQQQNVEFLRMSVVPWTTTVNVRGEAPRANDVSGGSNVVSIVDKGTQVQVGTPIDRSGRVNITAAQFGAVGWRGCVSGDGETKDPGDHGVASWKALSVATPMLQQTQVGFGDLVNKQREECRYDCRDDGRTNCGGGGGGGGGGTQGFYDLFRRTMPTVEPARIFGDRMKDAVDSDVSNTCWTCTRTNDCKVVDYQERVCGNWQNYINCWQDTGAGRLNPYLDRPGVCANYSCQARGTPVATTDIGPCVGDPNEPGLKNGTLKWCPWVSPTQWTQQDPITGPNINCPTPMLGLSGNRKQVIETIDRMTPVVGGTHADVGLRWGLRSLSPNNGWPAFFGLPSAPGPFRGQDRKIMILITDGENQQAVDYPGYWGCKGHANPGCSGSPDKAALDDMMRNWCRAIRTDYNVEIFAIAVNFSNAQAVQLVRECAPDPGHFFNIDAAELKRVLNIIAGSVIRLRITS